MNGALFIEEQRLPSPAQVPRDVAPQAEEDGRLALSSTRWWIGRSSSGPSSARNARQDADMPSAASVKPVLDALRDRRLSR
jgi:hypothetical protein